MVAILSRCSRKAFLEKMTFQLKDTLHLREINICAVIRTLRRKNRGIIWEKKVQSERTESLNNFGNKFFEIRTEKSE